MDVVRGKNLDSPGQFAGEPVLVMFICRHCPFVVHVQYELVRLGRDYASRLAIVAISSNDVDYDADDYAMSFICPYRELPSEGEPLRFLTRIVPGDYAKDAIIELPGRPTVTYAVLVEGLQRLSDVLWLQDYRQEKRCGSA